MPMFLNILKADADHDILQPQSGSAEELEGVSAPTVQ
jgi:hypothetical protein